MCRITKMSNAVRSSCSRHLVGASAALQRYLKVSLNPALHFQRHRPNKMATFTLDYSSTSPRVYATSISVWLNTNYALRVRPFVALLYSWGDSDVILYTESPPSSWRYTILQQCNELNSPMLANCCVYLCVEKTPVDIGPTRSTNSLGIKKFSFLYFNS